LKSLPDFTGMVPEEVKGILKADYPNLQYHFIKYSSPKERKEKINTAVTYRVVRQRVAGDNRIVITISPFLE